jgi:hypothetical protein
MRIRQPIDGMDRNAGFSKQPITTLADASNVRCRDVFESRVRLGSRPGLLKSFAQNIGAETPVESFTVDFFASKDLNIETGILQGTNLDGFSLDIGVISGAGKIERTLMHFDLGSIPTGAVVTSAILDIYENVVVNPTTGRIHRLTRPAWSETAATWLHWATGSAWTTVGGDYDLSGYAEWTTGPTGHKLISVTSLAQEAVADLTDHIKQLHLLFKVADETVPIKYITTVQRDSSEADKRPKLTIAYEV